MKTPLVALLLAVVCLVILVALATAPFSSGSADLPSSAGLDVESNPWIVWEALNIFGEIFVDRQSIMTTEECTCSYSCGGLCPPCVSVRRAKVMGPFCSEAEAWATICSRMTDRGRYVISSPCPWWVYVDGVKHTVDWNPWMACPEIGGNVVIPHPTCELPQPTATPTPSPTPTPQADWDISIRAVEYTQAIQCLDASDGDTTCADNSIQLVRDKYTVIRVYPTITVREGREPGDEDYMAATLRVQGQEGSEILPINGALGLNIEEDMDMDRNVADQSLNFLLPVTWTRQASLQLELKVGSLDDAITDTNQANNVKPLTLTFREQPRFKVLYIPIKYQSYSPAVYADEQIMRQAGRMLPVLYPLGQGGISYERGQSAILWAPLTGEDDHSLLRLLNRVYEMARKRNPATAPDQVFGWLPAGIEGFGLLGASDPKWFKPPGQGRVAYGRTQLVWQGVTFDPGRLLAHEIAHNLDVYHVTTEDACGAERFVDKQDWPYETGDIQETGYWPGGHIETPNDESCCTVFWQDKDIMTYCEDGPFPFTRWVSPHTYKKLMTGLESLRSTSLLAAAQDYLTVSGIVTPSGGLIETVEMDSSTDAPPTLQPDGAYCLEVQNGAGGRLSGTCFDSWFKSHLGGSLDEAGFYFVLPAPAGTQRVVLTQQGRVIDTRSASAHAPVVTITAPLPGASWDGHQTIRWTASDADGDPLTYSILYSHDGGNTWLTAAIDLNATSFEVDTAELRGGSQARLEVIANDGFLTGSAEVGPFSVARKAPYVEIVAPSDGARFRKGETISLVGVGEDLEDGTLPETAFSWTSSIAGALGTGFLVQTSMLPVGDHHITLTGHDSHGMTATATITLEVRLYTIDLPIIYKSSLPVMPTATPAACDLLFHDDFGSGSLAGWTANGGTWTNPGGYMFVRSGPVANAWNVKSVTVNNVSYEGTVVIRQGTSAGLSLRTISGTVGYDVIIDVNSGGAGVYERPVERWIAWYAFDAQRDVPYRLRVDAQWGRLDVYLDGVKRLTVADGSHVTGKLGVFAYNSQADFDDLRACRLSVPYEMRVNAGGSTYTDTQRLDWFEDQAYSAGNWGYEGSSLVGTSNDPVAGTEDDLLYRAVRWAYATFGYKFDVPNGSYQVRLLFVEPTFTQAGKRTFDVQIEGQTVVANLDLFTVAGHDNAYSRVFNVAVSDGQLNVSFVKKVENPLVSAIEVVSRATNTPTATRTAAVTATASRTPTCTVIATPTRTATRTPTAPPGSTATRTPTRPASTVRLHDGDVRTFTRKPGVLAYANRLYVTPPSGVAITDSGNVSPYAEWVFLMGAGQWIEATYANDTTAIGVQFWGDNSDGWARVLVDGIEMWTGSTYAPIGETYTKYLEISGMAAGVHRIRVECMGVNGAGGYDDVVAYIFGFGTTAVQP